MVSVHNPIELVDPLPNALQTKCKKTSRQTQAGIGQSSSAPTPPPPQPPPTKHAGTQAHCT